MPTCLFCDHEQVKPSYYPDTVFEGKLFSYVECLNCSLVFVDPLPTPEDLIKMYPPEYQGEEGFFDDAHYAHELSLLKKHFPVNCTVLDFGCGAGDFLLSAFKLGFNCVGVEFNPLQVERLKVKFPHIQFYTTEAFLADESAKYDVIRLSNVLEHLTTPFDTLTSLCNKLKTSGGVFIIGPLEENFNFARQIRKLYFIFKKLFQPGSTSTHAPRHILFSNNRNQLEFFQRIKLTAEHYSIIEVEWPFPQTLSEAPSLVAKAKWLVAKVSMAFSRLMPQAGNVFYYIGKLSNTKL